LKTEPAALRNQTLNPGRLWLIVIATLLWVTVSLFVVLATTNNHQLYPGVPVFVSGALWMLLMIRLLGGSLQHNLSWQRCAGKWYLWAVVMALVFWLVDHWFFAWLDPVQHTLDQDNWRQANQSYIHASVLLGTVLLAPLFEELFFRGVLFNALQAHLSAHWVVVVSAVLFACIHPSWPLVISVLLAGLMYGTLRQLSGSVLPALLAHLIHNALTFVLYAGV
jgi:membrane protease YdiL (CAAX protease family)